MRVCATEQMFNFGHKIKFNFQLPRLAIVCFWPCKNCTPRRYNEAIKKFSSWPELAHLLAIRAVATLRPLSLQLPHFGASKIHLQHPELSLHQPAANSICWLFAFSRAIFPALSVLAISAGQFLVLPSPNECKNELREMLDGSGNKVVLGK